MKANRFRFRAWDGVNDVMLVGIQDAHDTLGCMQDTQGNDVDYYGCSFGSYLDDDEQVIMQSTGQTDKNGVEVFEGDILLADLEYPERQVFIVEWVVCCFVTREVWPDRHGNHTIQIDQFDDAECLSVVGNIYETPAIIGETVDE